MGAYEPALNPPCRSTTPTNTAEFDITLVFGSSVLASYKGKNITVARNSAGKYTITLPRTYGYRVKFAWGWGKCAAGIVLYPVVLTSTPGTASSTGGGTFVIETRTEAGVATDPASGDELDLTFKVTNDALFANYSTTV